MFGDPFGFGDGFGDDLLEEEILLGGMSRTGRRGSDFLSEMEQIDAIEDLADGNVAGFVEDEILADLL